MPRILLIAMLAACSVSEAAPPTAKVELSAVTLGDNCPPTRAAQNRVGPPAATPGAFAPASRRCEPTSIQLSIAAPAGSGARVRVSRVELLDAKGARLQDLTVRDQLRFVDGTYERWAGVVEPGQTVAAMYEISSPQWDRLGGRANAHEKVFQVRVTYAIDGRRGVVVKQAQTAARIDPAVPT